MKNTIISLSLLVVFFSFYFYRYIVFINLKGLCQLDSKPIIFGEDLCGDIEQNKLQVRSSFLWQLFNLFTPKAVIEGTLGTKEIILKTLVPSEVFVKLEKDFYIKFNDRILHYKNSIHLIKNHIRSSVFVKPGSMSSSKFRLCPYNSNIENLFVKLKWEKFLLEDYLHLWTVLNSNPEPLMLQLLKPPDWPVPEFHGSCGRMIAVEDCGTTLTQFYYTPWIVRANLAYQLLKAALDFTFKDPKFAYYLTDLNPDNIAFTHQLKLKFIDLENVIVVDRNPNFQEHDKWKIWYFNHTTIHFACEDCISFEPDDICQHRISDHNVYAVCKEILSHSSLLPGGLLHLEPALPKSEEIQALIVECVQSLHMPRFETAQLIMSRLQFFL